MSISSVSGVAQPASTPQVQASAQPQAQTQPTDQDSDASGGSSTSPARQPTQPAATAPGTGRIVDFSA
jgi:hypothetical protein